MRQGLTDYNNLIRRTFVDIVLFPTTGVLSRTGERKIRIDRHDKFVRRIFNNRAWKNGGRFYGGWWQRLPKEWRIKIRIDDKPAIEIDYSGLHIVILYALEGFDYWATISKDPYRIPGLEISERMRDLLKQVLLTSINAKSKKSGIKAIQKELNFNPEQFDWVKKSEIDFKDVIDKFVLEHKQIERYFFSGKGLELQRLDSEIASHVINRFTAQKIPVLCVHDSFLIQANREAELRDAMYAAFEYVISKTKGLPKKAESKLKASDWLGGQSEFADYQQTEFRRNDKKLVLLEKQYGQRLKEHASVSWEEVYYKS